MKKMPKLYGAYPILLSIFIGVKTVVMNSYTRNNIRRYSEDT